MFVCSHRNPFKVLGNVSADLDRVERSIDGGSLQDESIIRVLIPCLCYWFEAFSQS